MKTWNWGIIGLGRIARKFADDLKLLPNARLHAVASTSAERAQEFASEYEAPHAYGTYEGIINCPDLDIVYIATPHVLHFENAMLCLEYGIPVLCEKPFAMNLNQARRMVAAARKSRVFLMEALWTLFIPSFTKAVEIIEKGEIGRLHTIKADFGFKIPFDPNSRLFNKALGGGVLLDIGIYPALLAIAYFGKPEAEHMHASSVFGPTDVDESTVFTFEYPDKRLALGHATIASSTPIEASLYGTEGSIYLHPRWHQSAKLTISKYEGRTEHKHDIDLPYDGWGYHFEAAHVMDCLEKGLLESPVASLELTLDLVETLDNIREKVGLEYF